MQNNRWVKLGTLALLAALAPSCDKPSVEPASERRPSMAEVEASLAEQAAEVRAGRAETIRLDRTLVTDEDLAALDGLQENLRRVNLSQTTVTDAGLARIAEMPRLIQIRLASDRITDEGLAALGRLDELEHLHLIDAPLTDSAVERLVKLEGLSSLYLDGTGITQQGMNRLVEELPETHLHFDGGHHRGDPRDDHEGAEGSP